MTPNPRPIFPVAVALAAAPLAALPASCGSEADPPSVAETRTVRAGNVTVTLSVSDTEITTVDRIEVALTARSPRDEPFDADAAFAEAIAAEGWTVVSATTRPPSLEGEHLVSTTVAVIEPYLPGEYAVPGIIVAADGNAATLQDIPVTVASVLPDGDPLQQSPELAELREPPPAPEGGPGAVTLVTFVAAGLSLACIAAARMSARRHDPTTADLLQDAARTARRIADAPAVTPDDLDDLDRAVRTAAPHAGRTDPSLIADLERARFAPSPPPDRELAALAERSEAYVRTTRDMFLVEQREARARA